MKRVFDNAMLAHVWAQQTQSEGRSANGNFFFRDSTIFSYGAHFPIARFIINGAGEKAVLFTQAKYSISTAKHISLVWRALDYGRGHNVIEVPALNLGDHEPAHYLERFKSAHLRAFTIAAEHKPGTKASVGALQDAQTLEENAHKLADFFGVPRLAFEPLSEAQQKQLFEAAQAQRKAANAAKKEHERQAKLSDLEKLAEWRTGANVGVSYILDTALRVAGEEIQTSKGARFPVDHAKKAFALIAACKAKGEGWKRDGHSIHLGHFQIDEIDAQGNVKAGCHYVKWEEIEACAKTLGLI